MESGRSDCPQLVFERDKHVGYFLHSLQCLPSTAQSQEVSRLTLAYFCIAGLDILDALEEVDKGSLVDWIFSLQVLPESSEGGSVGGFRGSPWLGIPYNDAGVPLVNNFDGPNIAMMYSALAALASLRALDQGRVHRGAALRTLARLQRPSGSFGAALEGGEDDVRFVFCAGAVDVPRSVAFLHKCRAYDGGYGLHPGLEAHGGATYCAVSALYLFHRLRPGEQAPPASRASGPQPAAQGSKVLGSDDAPGRETGQGQGQATAGGCGRALSVGAEGREGAEGGCGGGAHSHAWLGAPAMLLIHWIANRQGANGGFQGRRNKDPDTCYAFWLGATLHLLGQQSLPDSSALSSFLVSCQNSRIGGFSKYPGGTPDLLHSFYGVCGMSLLRHPGLKSLCPELGISKKAAEAAQGL